MAALDHGPAHPAEAEDPQIVARHARIGIWLFAAYLLLYVGFVLANALMPGWMALRPWGEINLAIWYGFGLIGAAGVVALIYSWLCRTSASAFSATHRTAADESEK